MVIFVTSSSSSKTESICIYYDVFDVGAFAGSSFIEDSPLYHWHFHTVVWIALVVLNPTSLGLLDSELVCESYGCFSGERSYRWT